MYLRTCGNPQLTKRLDPQTPNPHRATFAEGSQMERKKVRKFMDSRFAELLCGLPTFSEDLFFSPPAIWTCKVLTSPPSAVWICSVCLSFSLLPHQLDVQGLLIYTASSVANGHAGCIPLRHQQLSRAGCHSTFVMFSLKALTDHFGGGSRVVSFDPYS
jgi:hypothetical protein